MELDLFVPAYFKWENYICKKDEFGRDVIININEFHEECQDSVLFHAVNSCNGDRDIIILGEEIKPNLSPENITNILNKILQNIPYDIFYLSRYADLKKEHENHQEINGIKTMRVKSPHGIEALVISKNCIPFLRRVLRGYHGRGLDFTLNSLCKTLKAYSTENPLYSYVKIEKKAFKLKLYRDPEIINKNPKVNVRNQSLLNIFWFFFALIVIIFIAFDFILFVVDNSYTNEEILEIYKDCDPNNFDLMYLFKNNFI